MWYEWDRIITTIVAIYGAIMSTIALIFSRLLHSRRLTLKMSNGFLYYVNNTLSDDVFLIIEVINYGNVQATVSTPYLIAQKKKIVFPNPQSDVDFPCTLQAGGSCKLWVEMNQIKEFLKCNGYKGKVKIYAEVQEHGGKTFRSKNPLIIRLAEDE